MGAARGEFKRGAPSELATRGFARRVWALLLSLLPAPRAPLSRFARGPWGRCERARNARGARRARRARRVGSPRAVRSFAYSE